MKRLPGHIGTLSAVVLLAICLGSPVVAVDSGSPISHHVTPVYQQIEAGGTATLRLQSRDMDYFHPPGNYVDDTLSFTVTPPALPVDEWPPNGWTPTDPPVKDSSGWYDQTITKQYSTPGTYTYVIKADDTPGWDNDDPSYVFVTIDVVADTSPPVVIHVKPGGAGNHDGTSWANAMAGVQTAIDSASAGTEVWVAGDEQHPYSERITLKQGVGLYGGFAGTESSREQRNVLANLTILDGGQGGSVVTCPIGLTSSTAIDGFTIRNGSGTGAEYLLGGGIYCKSAAPVIRHNTIQGNGDVAYGGGIYCESCSGIRITDNVISGNQAPYGYGGGIYIKGSSGTIAGNTVVDNYGEFFGTYSGGVWCEDSTLTFANNILAYNSAGLYVESGELALRNNCVYGSSPGDDYYGITSGPGDISVPPSFVDRQNGDYHLGSNSQCKNAGDNSYVKTDSDLDGEYRIQDGTVDIGSDEYTGCIWYSVALVAVPDSAEVGSTVHVFATVRNPSTGIRVPSATVNFSVQGGTLGVSSTQTNGYGIAATTVTRSSMGYATVTAAVSVCGNQATGKCSVWFYPSTPISADAWPMFMHDERHTGASTQVDTASESLIESWHASVPTFRGSDSGDHPNRPSGKTGIFTHPYLDSSPVHAPGCPVIVGAWAGGEYGDAPTGYVVAFDPVVGGNADADDAPAWRFPRTGFIGAVASTPCIADVEGQKRVYVGSMDGKLYCLNAKTGEYIWSFQTASRGAEDPRILASPVVYDNRVYIGNESARMYCLNAATGLQHWSYDLPVDQDYRDRTGVSSAAIGLVDSQPRVYVGCDNGYLYCLSTADDPVPDPPGRVIWGYDAYGCVESSPTIYDGKVFAGVTWYGNEANNLIARNASNGSYAWNAQLTEEVRGTCAAESGSVYVGIDTGHIFFKRKADNGDPMSQFQLYMGDYFVGSSALCANLALVGNENGYFYALSKSLLYTVIASYLPPGNPGAIRSSPAVTYAAEAGCRYVYVLSRSDGGRLCAFQTTL